MKLVSTLCIALSILIGASAWKLTVPFITQNGTSVINTMTHDGRNGNRPLTIKISEDLSSKQHELLNFAFDIAKLDGFQFPQYLQSILMTESRACDAKNYRVAGLSNKPGDRYFGCGQIKLSAAKDVMNKYPEMWKFLESKTDEELQARLILDDRFNIRVASKYVIMMGINENPERAITAYNVGSQGSKNVNPKTHDYTRKVKEMTIKNVQGSEDDLKSSKIRINLARNDYY